MIKDVKFVYTVSDISLLGQEIQEGIQYLCKEYPNIKWDVTFVPNFEEAEDVSGVGE